MYKIQAGKQATNNDEGKFVKPSGCCWILAMCRVYKHTGKKPRKLNGKARLPGFNESRLYADQRESQHNQRRGPYDIKVNVRKLKS